MYGIAHTRAIPQRTASAVLFFGTLVLSLVGSGRVFAQEASDRCGHEYTNAPRDVSCCERLSEQSVTVIWGVRPQGVLRKHAAIAPCACSVLAQELARLEQQHQAWAEEVLVHLSQTGTAQYGAAPKNQDHVLALQVAMALAERETEALQREMARGPQTALPVAPLIAKP